MQDSTKKNQSDSQKPAAGAADQIADGAGSAARNDDPQSTATANPEAAIPESTQEDMGDGAGIRGGYGDSDQTNGLEGGPQTKSR